MRYPLLSRRSFLRAAGVSLALPVLEATTIPGWATGAKKLPPRRRMVAINHDFGFYAANFFPKNPGRDYTLSPLLEPLKDLKNDFTVFFGLSHQEVRAGHSSDSSFLSGAANFGRSTDRRSVTLDQLVAERIGAETRFDSMPLVTGNDNRGFTRSCSYTRSGVQVPAWGKAPAVFARLFLDGSPKEVQNQVDRLGEGRSVMDAVSERAKRLQARVGARDRDKLDQYFTSVRECEQNLLKAQAWATKPKPKVDMAPPKAAPIHDLVADLRVTYELMHLALQTDSTRAITLFVADTGMTPVAIPGVKLHYHLLSHHGQVPENLAQLHLIEMELTKALAGFLAKLKTVQEEGETLLDRTAVLFGSHLGDANGHSSHDLPILVAGGKFKHGQYLKFGSGFRGNKPLANVFVAILQHMGLEIDRFAFSTGTSVSGFELKG